MLNTGIFLCECIYIHMYLHTCTYKHTYYIYKFINTPSWPYELFLCGRTIMESISSDKRVLSLSGQQGLQTSLETLLDQLNRCQKALNEFLEVCTCTHTHMPQCTHMHVQYTHIHILAVGCHATFTMHALYFIYYRRSAPPFPGSILLETRIF